MPFMKVPMPDGSEWMVETDREAPLADVQAALMQQMKGMNEPPLEEQNPVSAMLRYGPSFIPVPGISGVASGLGELGAQQVEQGFHTPSAEEIGTATISGLIPPVVSGVVRGATALGKAGLSQARKGGVLAPLFESAAKTGDMVEVPSLISTLQEIKATLGPNPGPTAYRKLLREITDIEGRVAAGGQGATSLPIQEVMRIRDALGQLYTEAGRKVPPVLDRVYAALSADLKRAAEQGGAGAQMLTRGLGENAAARNVSRAFGTAKSEANITQPLRLLSALPAAGTQLIKGQRMMPLEVPARIGGLMTLSDLLRTRQR